VYTGPYAIDIDRMLPTITGSPAEPSREIAPGCASRRAYGPSRR
jgi:hypothetical protein